MKTSKFLVSAVLGGMLLVSTVSATEGDKPGNASLEAKNAVREQIVSALSDISAIDQTVLIRFSVSDKSGFELLKVEGENTALVNTVKAELASENISVSNELEGTYSLKVRFSDTEVVKEESADDVLRNKIADALSNVKANESSSVKVVVFVNNSSLKVKKVEGSNKALVSSVESALTSSAIVPPAELAGNYQVTVKF